MTPERVSYTLYEAAEATGISEKTIRRAQAEGQLRFYYRTARPVILASDLLDWIKAAPIERQAAP